MVCRRVNEIDDDTRRNRARRSPASFTSSSTSTNSSSNDRRQKARSFTGNATPEDLIAARGVALLRLSLVASPAAGTTKTARDLGMPPWDLPWMSDQLNSCTFDKLQSNSPHAGSELGSPVGFPANKENEDTPGSMTSPSENEFYCESPSSKFDMLLEFQADLWVRGQQRTDPFLERLLTGQLKFKIVFTGTKYFG